MLLPKSRDPRGEPFQGYRALWEAVAPVIKRRVEARTEKSPPAELPPQPDAGAGVLRWLEGDTKVHTKLPPRPWKCLRSTLKGYTVVL